MSRTAATLLLGVIATGIFAGTSKNNASLPLKPTDNGCAGLSVSDCAFVKQQYGAFELLDDATVEFPLLPGWAVRAFGRFLPDAGMQFAMIVRPMDAPAGMVLIMVAKSEPADSATKHGVFFHSPLGVERILMRTKIARETGVDTLEFACDEKGEVCGKAYWDSTVNDVRLGLVSARK
jgi:hypothetical protein